MLLPLDVCSDAVSGGVDCRSSCCHVGVWYVFGGSGSGVWQLSIICRCWSWFGLHCSCAAAARQAHLLQCRCCQALHCCWCLLLSYSPLPPCRYVARV